MENNAELLFNRTKWAKKMENGSQSIAIAHLSDIHISSGSDQILGRTDKIALAIASEGRAVSAFFLAISGDIVNRGLKEEYELAKSFLLGIKQRLELETNKAVHIVVAPGNHDCDFSGDQQMRDLAIADVRSKGEASATDVLINVCTAVQKNFEEFREAVEKPSQNNGPLFRSHRFSVGDKVVGFDVYNTAWMSTIKESHGSLIYPINKQRDLFEDIADIVIAMFHHPFSWLSSNSARSAKRAIRQMAAIVLTGHEHVPLTGVNSDAESGSSAYVEGGVLQDSKSPESTFNILQVDFATSLFSSTTMRWDIAKELYAPLEKGAWSSILPQVAAGQKGSKFCPKYLQKISDAGGAFHHPSKQHIELWDIYVYPDLRYENEIDAEKQAIVRSSRLLTSAGNLAGGILVKGGEKSGKTSLLYSLFESFAEQGLLPIYIDGAAITINNRRLEELEKSAIKEQYVDDFYEGFRQSEKAKRIALVDDLDRNKLTVKQRSDLISELKDRYDYFCVTTSELIDIDELVDPSLAAAISTLPSASILEFGYQRQLELIQRWLGLGEGENRDKAALIIAIDASQRYLDQFFGRSLVPRVPLLLVTVIQTIDSSSVDLQKASLGECYRALITNALIRAKVKPEEVREYLRYCSCLSWLFGGQNRKAIQKSELRDFDNWFSKEIAPGDFEDRMAILRECGIIQEELGAYSFKYQYTYYYFIGDYLSRYLTEPVTKRYVEQLCECLYVRDNANKILFLAHHCKDATVLTLVTNVLRKLFSNHEAFSFKDANSRLGSILADAPELVFHESDPLDNRKEIAKHRDKSTKVDFDDHDGSDKLLSSLISLFKTSEIVGLILKTQYSDLESSTKIGAIDTAVQCALRALTDFTIFVQTDRDALVAHMEKALAERTGITEPDEKAVLARRVAFHFVTYVMWSMLHRSATSVGSEKIRHNLNELVKKSGSPAYQLVEILSGMESTGNIPISTIQDICRAHHDNPFLMQVLRIAVLNHLYMFKNSRVISQQVCEILGVSVKTQKMIEFKKSHEK